MNVLLLRDKLPFLDDSSLLSLEKTANTHNTVIFVNLGNCSSGILMLSVGGFTGVHWLWGIAGSAAAGYGQYIYVSGGGVCTLNYDSLNQ